MDRIETLAYLAARFALWTLAHGPLALARFYIALLDVAMPRLRQVGRRNLALAFPEKSQTERDHILEDVYRSLGRMAWTFARFPQINKSNVDKWIRYEGFEHFSQAKQAGRGVLFATAHFGNWELSAYAHALLTEPMDIVVRPLDNAQLNQLAEERRTLSGNQLIGKWDAARPILRALKQNRAVGILIDQNTTLDEGVFVDFFGTPACSNPVFARLAEKTGAVVLPGFALWSDEERRYVLHFLEPVPVSGDTDADTARIQAVLEEAIRQQPGQWLWIHRRWKTRPPGAPSLYS